MSENKEPNNGATQQQGKQGGNVAQKAQETVQKAKKAKKTVQNVKKMAHAIKNISAAAPLAQVLFWALVVIVILIIIIGVIMFLVTMPGMIMGKLKELFGKIGDFCAAFYGADTTKNIDADEVFSTLEYIEEMGWDLKGEGFLTGFYKTGDETEIEEQLEDLDIDYESYEPDDKQGVVRNENDEIILAKSDFIFTYIMSDNYVYTLKNDNIVTVHEDDNFWGKVAGGSAGVAKKMGSLILGPLRSDSHNKDVAEYGKGLIALYYDKGLGIEGNALNTYNIWENGSIDINAEEKTIYIENDGWFNNNNPIKFSLDGWTGRYGMPVEFLLSVHKATMMPDLAYDMATHFNTNVNIYLHEISGESLTAYKTNEGTYIEEEELRKRREEFSDRSLFGSIFNFFDDWADTADEAWKTYEAGVDILGTGISPCGCEPDILYITDENEPKVVGKNGDKWYYYKNGKKSDGLDTDKEYTGTVKEQRTLHEICEYCEEAAGEVMRILAEDFDPDFAAYAPYIANVTNHWYRDVYFVLDNSNKSFVEYDYDYEALMKERWTLYETYTDKSSDGYKYNPDKVGEFIYFIINDEGEYKKENGNYVLFDGEVEDARPSVLYEKVDEKYVEYEGNRNDIAGKNIYRLNSDGKYVEYTGDVAIAKKAITFNSQDKSKLEDLGWKKRYSGMV